MATLNVSFYVARDACYLFHFQSNCCRCSWWCWWWWWLMMDGYLSLPWLRNIPTSGCSPVWEPLAETFHEYLVGTMRECQRKWEDKSEFSTNTNARIFRLYLFGRICKRKVNPITGSLVFLWVVIIKWQANLITDHNLPRIFLMGLRRELSLFSSAIFCWIKVSLKAPLNARHQFKRATLIWARAMLE